MRRSNITRKSSESIKRSRQKEIMEIKSIRDTKKRIGKTITNKDYHETGHLRHGKF